MLWTYFVPLLVAKMMSTSRLATWLARSLPRASYSTAALPQPITNPSIEHTGVSMKRMNLSDATKQDSMIYFEESNENEFITLCS